MEKSPSPFQPPNNHSLPFPLSPTGDENVPPVPAKESPPPTMELNSQTSPPSQPRPGTPDFFLANSNYSMPGAYPTTPLTIDPRTQSADTSVPYTPERKTPPSGKRRESTSSIRNLLASLRRPSNNEQPRLSDDSLEGSHMKRPITPSQDSMASSSRSLKKKMSGSFWTRRKSSLGIEVMMDTGGQSQTQTGRSTSSTPATGQNGHSTSPQAVHSPTSPKDSSEGGSMMSSIRKRKSGTFWGKRNSSLGMESRPNTVVGGADKIFQGHARTTSTASGPSSVDHSPPQPLRQKKSASFWKRKPSLDLNRAATPTQYNVTGFASSPTQPIKENATGDESDVRVSDAGSYDPVQRSDSPAPVLPELNLGLGGELGNGSLTEVDDMFASIGKD